MLGEGGKPAAALEQGMMPIIPRSQLRGSCLLWAVAVDRLLVATPPKRS